MFKIEAFSMKILQICCRLMCDIYIYVYYENIRINKADVKNEYAVKFLHFNYCSKLTMDNK